MIAQYTQAALVAENRRLAAPGERRLAADERDAGGPRVDGLVGRAQAAHRAAPTSPASSPSSCPAPPTGSTCARRSQPGPGGAAALAAVRARVAGPGPDRWLAPDLAAAEELVAGGALLDAVEAAVGAMA